jgi:hypothetical protein
MNAATNSTQRKQQCASLLDKCTAMTAATLKACTVSPVRKTVRSTGGAVAEGHNGNSGINSSNPLMLYQCSITHATAPIHGVDSPIRKMVARTVAAGHHGNSGVGSLVGWNTMGRQNAMYAVAMSHHAAGTAGTA